jgi:hypothetical protein
LGCHFCVVVCSLFLIIFGVGCAMSWYLGHSTELEVSCRSSNKNNVGLFCKQCHVADIWEYPFQKQGKNIGNSMLHNLFWSGYSLSVITAMINLYQAGLGRVYKISYHSAYHTLY